MINLGNIKIFVIVALLLGGYHYYRNAEEAKRNLKRVENNFRQEQQKDSSGYSEKVFNKAEIKEVVKYDPELKKLLKENNIKIKNLTQLVQTQNEYIYSDTTKYVLHEILKGIKEGRKVVQRVQSSNECHLVAANIHFNGKDLYIDSLDVKFKTRTDIIASMEKWKLKHIFKKRKITLTTVDKCGKSLTELIKIE